VTRRHEFKAVHGLRKFFQTNSEPKMKSLHVMMLMGHDIGLAASYAKPRPDDVLEEYLKAADNLTIYNTPRLNDISRNQQALATEIQAKDQEMQALRNEILARRKKEDEMQEQIEEIRGLYQGLSKTLDEVADLRAKIRANPKEFLEADPFKFVTSRKRRRQISKDVAKQATRKNP
jgi:septal ring factor EnvC (AmiA/AmiB activator)